MSFFLRRLHGIELLDIPRCPRAIRDGATDYLQFIIRAGNAYDPIIERLAATLRKQRISNIVDVCSGGGGPWPELRTALVRAGAPDDLCVTLTDQYPNLEAFARASALDRHVAGDRTPRNIEQQAVPHSGLRTFFSSFHHFNPATAEQVLRNAAASRQPIFIAEATERSALAIGFMLFAPLMVWLATPRLRPFTWTRLFLTYVIPAIPLAVCFDGIVSCFRTYTTDELRELVRSVSDLEYEWELGQELGRGQLPVTFALGLPTSRAD